MRKAVKSGVLCVGVLFICAGAAPAAAPPELPAVAAQAPAPWNNYRSFARMTGEPRSVPHSLAVRCSIPGKAEMDKYREDYGPHLQALVHVYANDAAQAELARRERRFPAGAIIVKEKLGRGMAVVGIGGMQKMPPGYDPEGGDWKYFYSETPGKFAEGKLGNCRSCHMRARAMDHVYFSIGAEGEGR